MSRFSRLAVLAVAAALLVAAAPAATSASDGGPTATAAKSCSVGDFDSYGTTYVLWIRARRVSCRKARERVRAFHACRPGPRGRCPNLGSWNCTEDRGPKISTQFYSTAKCKKGRKVVKHRYQQNTD